MNLNKKCESQKDLRLNGKKKYIDKKQPKDRQNAEKNMVKKGDQNEAV
jgi:hypothetical protein